MGKLILILVLALLGTGAGIAGGIALTLSAEDEATDKSEHVCEPQGEAEPELAEPVREGPSEYVRLANQFVVPVVKDDRVASLVVMSLSLEVAPGTRERALAAEPKIRDEFLRAMFLHANIGGFSGDFTRGERIEQLRKQLTRGAREIVGQEAVYGVLITDIARQDQ